MPLRAPQAASCCMLALGGDCRQTTRVFHPQDSNIYLFDCRKLNKTRGVLCGHVETVLTVDFAPTGRELVSGGFDRYAMPCVACAAMGGCMCAYLVHQRLLVSHGWARTCDGFEECVRLFVPETPAVWKLCRGKVGESGRH